MTIALVLNEGSGTAFKNKNITSAKAPVMLGYVEFMQSKERNQKVKLDVAIWVKERQNGDKFYSLSVGGINASLFKENPQSEKEPDYAGSFGYNNEMRIAAWKKPGTNGGDPYLSLSITPKKPAGQASSAAPTGTPAPTDQPIDTGVADFDF